MPFGSKRAPIAVTTRLGWALQGPTVLPGPQDTSQCVLTSITSPNAELKHDGEKLWQADILPYRNDMLITRSKQDREAMELLQEKTTRVNVDGIELRVKNAQRLQSPKDPSFEELSGSCRRNLI